MVDGVLDARLMATLPYSGLILVDLGKLGNDFVIFIIAAKLSDSFSFRLENFSMSLPVDHKIEQQWSEKFMYRNPVLFECFVILLLTAKVIIWSNRKKGIKTCHRNTKNNLTVNFQDRIPNMRQSVL